MMSFWNAQMKDLTAAAGRALLCLLVSALLRFCFSHSPKRLIHIPETSGIGFGIAIAGCSVTLLAGAAAPQAP